ncbi:spore protease YyaC [Bacillaceae bacterium S4-13-58]
MNLQSRFFKKNQEFRVSHKEKLASYTICETLHHFLMESSPPYVFICIGTDRSTGDSLGPLVGTFLKDKHLKNTKVYGTLDNPIHAMNLVDTLANIKEIHPNSPFVAIDACLGKSNSIGDIITKKGPVMPGAAVKKDLPAVGDYQMTGIVNVSGYMEYMVLQSTRLSIIMQMAKVMSDGIYMFDRQSTMPRKEEAPLTIDVSQ